MRLCSFLTECWRSVDRVECTTSGSSAGLGWAGLGWAGLDMPGWLRWAVSGVQLCHVTVSPQPADASMGLVTCNTPCHTVCNTVTLYVTLPLHTVCHMLMLHTKVESCHVVIYLLVEFCVST